MKNIFYVTLFALVIMCGKLQAQQLPLSSLYNVNKFQQNSAYAGYTGCLEGYLSHRTQWVGMDGAPTTNYLSIHSGIAKNMGLGANLVYDKTDVISKFSGSLSYAYGLKLGVHHNLRLGLSAGIYQININPSNAIAKDVNDAILLGGNQTSIAFKNEFSIYYTIKRLEIGISVPQILETKSEYDFNTVNGSFGQTRHIVGSIGYELPLSKKISIEPSLFYRSSNGKQSQLDVNGQLNYTKVFFVGAGYRTSSGVLARMGMNLKERFVVAYVYEFSSGNVSDYSGGSHEIMLGVKFCKNKLKDAIVDLEPDAETTIKTDQAKAKAEAEAKAAAQELAEAKAKEEAEAKAAAQELAEAKAKEEAEAKVAAQELAEAKEEPKEEKEDIVREELIREEIVLESKPVSFNIDSANSEMNNRENSIRYSINESAKSISSNEKRLVDNVVEVLKENPALKVQVEGHTCDLGSKEFNKLLSEKRSKRIRKLIISRGIDQGRVSYIGRGEAAPRVPNTSEKNRVENRRVQLKFSE